MKAITMREFARLCTDDPAVHEQVLAIRGTICPEKVYALAERNGYRIVPEGVEELDLDALDQVVGGAGPQTNQNADWFTWLRIWTGIGAT